MQITLYESTRMALISGDCLGSVSRAGDVELFGVFFHKSSVLAEKVVFQANMANIIPTNINSRIMINKE